MDWLDIDTKAGKPKNQDKNREFMGNILSEFKKVENKNIVWLRISDSGTTGLNGVEKSEDQTKKWFSFIKGVGINTKEDDDAGGSKGVGKNAIFANSKIRTMFVSTYTDENEKGFIGVSKLITKTCKKEKGDETPDWTYGVGYCVNDDDVSRKYMKPTKGELNLDTKFSRSEGQYGTDIFVPFFNSEFENWTKNLISEAIISFMPAILDGELEVIVKDKFDTYRVDKMTLSSRVNDLNYFEKESIQNIANELYQTLVHPVSTFKYKPGTNKEMVLLVGASTPHALNKVYPYRWGTKLRIGKLTPATISKRFTAALLIKGSDICKKLRAIEDVTHMKWYKSKWVHSGYEKEEIARVYDSVIKFFNEKLEELEFDDTKTESDFSWAADAGWSSEETETLDGTKNEDSGLPSEEISFEAPKTKKERKAKPRKKKASLPDENGDAESYIEGQGVEDENGESIGSHPEGENHGHGGEYRPGDKDILIDESEDGTKMMIKRNVKTIKSKMPVSDISKGKFNLSFTPSTSGTNVEVTIEKSGVSDETEDVSILSASFKGKKLKTEGNKIYMDNMNKGEEYKIELTLKEHKLFVWEVNVNAD
ncbi:MAG: hypothetical protein MJ214_03465 [Bacilli bacterium]|nr:hypothetical protein [Bacilli bacterium]